MPRGPARSRTSGGENQRGLTRTILVGRDMEARTTERPRLDRLEALLSSPHCQPNPERLPEASATAGSLLLAIDIGNQHGEVLGRGEIVCPQDAGCFILLLLSTSALSKQPDSFGGPARRCFP